MRLDTAYNPYPSVVLPSGIRFKLHLSRLLEGSGRVCWAELKLHTKAHFMQSRKEKSTTFNAGDDDLPRARVYVNVLEAPSKRMIMASSTELEHVKGVWERMRGKSPIYDFLLSDVELISAIKGSITAHLILGKNHVNSRGTIHGAVSASLADWSGGLAIATHGMEKTGASIDIHVTYVGTAQVGDTIEIEALANKLGRAMAFTTIRICKLVDGKPGPMVATASHTKYISQPKQ